MQNVSFKEPCEILWLTRMVQIQESVPKAWEARGCLSTSCVPPLDSFQGEPESGCKLCPNLGLVGKIDPFPQSNQWLRLEKVEPIIFRPLGWKRRPRSAQLQPSNFVPHPNPSTFCTNTHHLASHDASRRYSAPARTFVK